MRDAGRRDPPGFHAALEQGLPAIPGDVLKPPTHEFRHAVLAGLASDDVTQDRLDTRSYIDTVRKHGKNAGASVAGSVPQFRTALRKHG